MAKTAVNRGGDSIISARKPLLTNADGSTDLESSSFLDASSLLLPSSPSAPSSSSPNKEHSVTMSNLDCICWWCIGMLNNISFVICAASAKDILPGNVGVVYLANSFPSLLIRLSAPYWFDKVSYEIRMSVAFALFVAGFCAVALFESDAMKLLGVMMVSSQCGLGETSMLALSTRYGNISLTLWSSGTGAAGLLGYLYVYVINTTLGISSRSTLLFSSLISVLYYGCFRQFKIPPALSSENPNPDPLDSPRQSQSSSSPLTFQDRLKLTFGLWRWGVPLIVVYFAEYAMQSGTWTAIGFPVDSCDARKNFYQYAGFSYQAGVLISRSSGTVWRPSLPTLWIMPTVQMGLLAFTTLNGKYHWWYDNSLLVSSVVVGFFGGAVYVNGFRLVAENIKPEVVELATAALAVTCDIGTNLGEGFGLWIQHWLESSNGITGQDC